MTTMSTVTEQTVATTPLWKDGKNGNIQFLSTWKRLEKEDPFVFNLVEQREDFETEDSNYKYKVGMSKYGLWLSRKKKPIFIPDPVPLSTSMVTSQPVAATEESNGSSNNNNGNNNQQNQQKEQQPQQQQQQVVYPYSVKIEQSSSGAAKISIHTYNVDPDAAKDDAIRLFIQTQEELKSKGIKVLEA